MNLQTFTGSTLQECIARVKGALGPNAVILHTRTYSKREWLGLRKREFVEITAARAMSGQQRRGNSMNAAPIFEPASQPRTKALTPFASTAAKPAVVRAGSSDSAIITMQPPGRGLL